MDRAGSSVAPSHVMLSSIATIAGSFFTRMAGAATGVMLGIMLGHLRRAGNVDASEFAITLLAASFYLSELIGSPLAGVLVDRRGLRTLLFAGPILGIVAELLFSGPTNLAPLTLARLLQGLTTACTIPAALAYLSDATFSGHSQRSRLMSLFEVGSIGGMGMGYAVGGILFEHLHVRGFFVLAAVYGLAVAMFLFVHGGRTPPVRRPGVSLRAIRKVADLMPSWLALNAAAGLWFGQAAYQFSGAHPRLGQHLTLGLTGTQIGLIFGVYALLFALGTIGWGWLLGRVHLVTALKVGALGVVGSAAGIAAINHSGEQGPLWVIAAILLAIAALIAETAYTPAALTLLAARSDDQPGGRGAVMGVYSMLLAGGQLAGSIIGGEFAAAWGVDGLILATALLGIVAWFTLPRLTGLSPLTGRGLRDEQLPESAAESPVTGPGS